MYEKLETDGVKEFVEDIQLGNLKSSYQMAARTLLILQRIVSEAQWTSAQDLIEYVQSVTEDLHKADHTETVPANVSLHVLKIIREEYQNLLNKLKGGSQSRFVDDMSFGLIQTIDEKEIDYTNKFDELRELILDGLNEYMTEIAGSAENISKEAERHINDNDVIMTLGKSKTVEAFFKKAAKKGGKFRVIVAECAPFSNGHELSVSLAETGISVTIISDSAIFTHMSRASKVVLGTHSVMANGGLKTMAKAAKYYSLPLLVLAAMFKYTPQYLVSHEQVAFNKCDSPRYLLPFSHQTFSSKCDAMNLVFDYVPPELITVLIAGSREGHSPSYVYHKLATLYHKKDYL